MAVIIITLGRYIYFQLNSNWPSVNIRMRYVTRGCYGCTMLNFWCNIVSTPSQSDLFLISSEFHISRQGIACDERSDSPTVTEEHRASERNEKKWNDATEWKGQYSIEERMTSIISLLQNSFYTIVRGLRAETMVAVVPTFLIPSLIWKPQKISCDFWQLLAFRNHIACIWHLVVTRPWYQQTLPLVSEAFKC